MHHQYLLGALMLVPLWLFFYVKRPDLRDKIILSSLLCLPLGISQPFYVPEYWNPDAILGFTVSGYYFDIESFLYCFLIGGVAAGKYETFFGKNLEKIRPEEAEITKNRIILLITLAISTLSAVALLDRFIWTSLIGLYAGVMAILATRSDLWRESFFGGLTYLIVHVVIILILDPLLYPGWVSNVWNITGALNYRFITVPLGEMLFAFGFGSLWAPLYEDIEGYRIRN